MDKIRMSLPNRIKSFLYYYFRCFKRKNDHNLSDYDEDYTDSEIVSFINLNN